MPLAGFEAVPRYAELVHRLLGEEVDFVPPGFELEIDRPEWAFLKRELLWAVQPIGTAAVAAQLGFLQLRNPSGSNRIVVVQRWFARKLTAGNFSLSVGTTVRGATGAGFAIARDMRWNDPIVPLGALTARDSVVVESGTAAAFGTDVQVGLDEGFAANVGKEFVGPLPVILAPGTTCLLTSGTVNEAATISAAGYSRAARPEELRI